ncbi:hypothetical protein PILCRDRAFT_828876 [Piloderma croceum F 1598]|uniref:Uncharacterized protein n=1 Tax=Piloderma croceum (strain F 1598) TaxID=765440 RepID=A0A0C3B8P0_PILCF|nr:hypothetical protein PILCRDRAFT_828876 [Piloderma croceum F 1598]
MIEQLRLATRLQDIEDAARQTANNPETGKSFIRTFIVDITTVKGYPITPFIPYGSLSLIPYFNLFPLSPRS